MSVKDSQLRWAVCITIAAMIGSNSNANHLWYFMYEIEKSEEAPLTCLLVSFFPEINFLVCVLSCTAWSFPCSLLMLM